MEERLYLLMDIKKMVGQKIKFLGKVFLSPSLTENPTIRYKDLRDQRISRGKRPSVTPRGVQKGKGNE